MKHRYNLNPAFTWHSAIKTKQEHRLRWLHHFHAQRSTTTLALKMACRLASAPVLTASVLKRLQDLGIKKSVLLLRLQKTQKTESVRIPFFVFEPSGWFFKLYGYLRKAHHLLSLRPSSLKEAPGSYVPVNHRPLRMTNRHLPRHAG